jgi:glycogen operon protein
MDGLMLCFGMLLDGRAQPSGLKQRGQDATILIVFNAYHDIVNFKLPEYGAKAEWSLQLDTNLMVDQQETEGKHFKAGHEYTVTGRSILVFVLREPPALREPLSLAEKETKRV